MPAIKKGYSAVEIAGHLNVTPRAIQMRAEAEQWPAERRPSRLGGNLYPFDTLPEPIRVAIYAKHFGVAPVCIDDGRLDPAEIKARLDRFEQAAPKHQAEGLARREIVSALAALAEREGLGREQVLPAMVGLYKRQAVPGLAAEVYAHCRSVCVESLRRWRKAFAAQGVCGLVPEKRGVAKGSTQILPALITRWEAAIAACPHITGAELIRIMKNECDPADWVHKATVHRWYKNYQLQNAKFLAYLRDPRDAKNRFQPAMGSLSVAVPHAGHTWQMDSTPADVRTTDDRRCAIVAVIDVYSRRVVLVVVPTSKSLAVAACMRKGILAWGLPEVLVKDNGKEYSSKHIVAACDALEIKTPKVAPYTPEHKGNIERFFGTFARDLEANLPCFLGHSVAQQAAIRERGVWLRILKKQPNDEAVNIPLTMAQLQEVADKWLEVYERRVHRGFANEPGCRNKGLTPLEAWEQSAAKPKTIRRQDERVLDILLASGGTYTVQKGGLFIHGGRYVDASLAAVTGEKVQVKFDYEDAGHIFVYQGKKFIGEAINGPLKGQRLSDVIAAQKRVNREMKKGARLARELSKATHRPYIADVMNGTLEVFNTPPEETGPDNAILEFRAPANTAMMETTRAGLAEIEASQAEPPLPSDYIVRGKPPVPEPTFLEITRELPPIEQHEAFKAEAAKRELTPEELDQWKHAKTYKEVELWEAIPSGHSNKE